MPIYEYSCQDCGSRFEKLLRRASDAEELACPSCGKRRLRQELSVFAAHAGGGARSPQAPMCPRAGGCANAGMCGMGE